MKVYVVQDCCADQAATFSVFTSRENDVRLMMECDSCGHVQPLDNAPKQP